MSASFHILTYTYSHMCRRTSIYYSRSTPRPQNAMRQRFFFKNALCAASYHRTTIYVSSYYCILLLPQHAEAIIQCGNALRRLKQLAKGDEEKKHRGKKKPAPRASLRACVSDVLQLAAARSAQKVLTKKKIVEGKKTFPSSLFKSLCLGCP